MGPGSQRYTATKPLSACTKTFARAKANAAQSAIAMSMQMAIIRRANAVRLHSIVRSRINDYSCVDPAGQHTQSGQMLEGFPFR